MSNYMDMLGHFGLHLSGQKLSNDQLLLYYEHPTSEQRMIKDD